LLLIVFIDGTFTKPPTRAMAQKYANIYLSREAHHFAKNCMLSAVFHHAL